MILRKREIMKLTLCILSVFLCRSLLAAEPIKLHPDNPHYFLFRGKPAILIGSTEHYGAVLNLDMLELFMIVRPTGGSPVLFNSCNTGEPPVILYCGTCLPGFSNCTFTLSLGSSFPAFEPHAGRR